MNNKSHTNLDNLKIEKYFTLRGLETTRLDTFIDAAFAFATTMLIISIGNIPKNFHDLILAFKGIPSFLASFTSVIFIWLGHRKWSRRFGIENNFTLLLSLCLVFVLMIYIYPLRLIFSAFFSWVSEGFFPSEFTISTGKELTGLFVFYGLGFSTISFLLGSLNYYSLKIRDEIHLGQIEILLTKLEMTNWFVLSIAAFISTLIALLMPLKIGQYAGFIYFFLPVLMPAIAILFKKKIKKLISENFNAT